MHVPNRRPVSQSEHESQAPDHEDVNEDLDQQEKFVCSFVVTFHRQKIKVSYRVPMSQKYPFKGPCGVSESFFEGGKMLHWGGIAVLFDVLALGRKKGLFGVGIYRDTYHTGELRMPGQGDARVIQEAEGFHADCRG
jgi:hypothetical protein